MKRFIVPVDLVVLGENEEEAYEYAMEGLVNSDMLDQDGIVAIDIDAMDIDDIYEQEDPDEA